MFASLKKWLAQKPFGDTWHKFQKNGIAFFLYGALKAQTLIPAVAGRNGVMGKVFEKMGSSDYLDYTAIIELQIQK